MQGTEKQSFFGGNKFLFPEFFIFFLLFSCIRSKRVYASKNIREHVLEELRKKVIF